MVTKMIFVGNSSAASEKENYNYPLKNFLGVALVLSDISKEIQIIIVVYLTKTTVSKAK